MKHQPQAERAGFTLAEMLVVITILILLMSLLAAAVLRFSSLGPRLATQTNLNKTRDSLVTQLAGVRAQAQNDNLSSNNNKLYVQLAITNFNTANGTTAGNAAVPGVKNWYVLQRIKQAFPTRFDEVFWPDADPKMPANTPYAYGPYVTYLGNLNVTPQNRASWGSTAVYYQQAICALMILVVGPKNAGLTVDNLGTGAVAQFPIGGAGFSQGPGLADAWGRPVAFTRNYDDQAMVFGLLSAGKDGLYGVYDMTLTGKPPGGGPANPLGNPPLPPAIADPVNANAATDNVVGVVP
jgi:hypothetical protein